MVINFLFKIWWISMTLYEVQVRSYPAPGPTYRTKLSVYPYQVLYFVLRLIHVLVAAVNIKLLLFSAIFEALEHTEWVNFLGKKARKAKAWLKQLSTSSDKMDLTEHDLIYYGLEKRIRKGLILNFDWLGIVTPNSDWLGIITPNSDWVRIRITNSDWPTWLSENPIGKLTY